jgi:Na+/H+-translocating membrane pyrophosphatase
MATTAMQLAIDALDRYDNAGGIAEMSELPKKFVQERIF